MTLIEPHDPKRLLRSLMRAMRPCGDDAALVARLLELPLLPEMILAGVWPLPDEPTLVPAWREFHRRGYRIVLPETTAPGEALQFRLWKPGDVLVPGRFGTCHPNGPTMQPDIVFVPLLAWDRQLHRVGHGGGYYDRTLAILPDAVAIGFGFMVQEVASVPVGPYDVSLDAVLTERDLVMAEGQTLADLVSGRHRRSQRA